MKRSKLVLAAASFVLAAVSVAATKPMRLLTNAYVQELNGDNSPKACTPIDNPCIAGDRIQCQTLGGQFVFATVDPFNSNLCQTPFIRN